MRRLLLLSLLFASAACSVCYHPELDPRAHEALLRKEVEAADRAGRRDGALATSLNNLGELCRASGRTTEAERYFLRAIDVESSLGKPDKLNLAISYDNLVVLYTGTKNFQAGREASARALGLLDEGAGHETVDLAVALSNRGMLELEEAHLEDAERYVLRSVSILDQPLGAGTWQRRQALENLKLVYEKAARPSDAAAVQRRLDDLSRKKAPA